MHKRTIQMINNINIIYRYYILNNKKDIFDLINNKIYKVNINKINIILENLKTITEMISKNLNEKWNFNRLDNLEKAILTVSTYDIKYIKIDKKIIINEAVNISKMLLINDNYKYINAVLDKI